VTAEAPQDEDLLDTAAPGSRARMSRLGRRVVVGAVLAVVVTVVCQQIARQRTHSTSDSPAPPSAAVLTPTRLEVDGSAGCGTLDGNVFSVAFAVLNTGGQDAVVDDVHPVLPLGGLRPLGGLADRPPSGAGCPTAVLRLGDTLADDSGGWIALRFLATVPCLTPLPIEVQLVYDSDGATVTSLLNPFPDLGSVAAAARHCPTVTATSTPDRAARRLSEPAAQR
jgi:hypothetical protein